MNQQQSIINKPEDVVKCHLDSLHNPEFCDIKIVGSDGGVIAASKLLLRLRSSYFHCMFSQQSNFVESRDATVELPFTKAVLEKLVRYLYSGQLACEDMSLQSLLELMGLLNMVNLATELVEVEGLVKDKIKKRKFSLSDCLMALDETSRHGLESVGVVLVSLLADDLGKQSV